MISSFIKNTTFLSSTHEDDPLRGPYLLESINELEQCIFSAPIEKQQYDDLIISLLQLLSASLGTPIINKAARILARLVAQNPVKTVKVASYANDLIKMKESWKTKQTCLYFINQLYLEASSLSSTTLETIQLINKQLKTHLPNPTSALGTSCNEEILAYIKDLIQSLCIITENTNVLHGSIKNALLDAAKLIRPLLESPLFITKPIIKPTASLSSHIAPPPPPPPSSSSSSLPPSHSHPVRNFSPKTQKGPAAHNPTGTLPNFSLAKENTFERAPPSLVNFSCNTNQLILSCKKVSARLFRNLAMANFFTPDLLALANNLAINTYPFLPSLDFEAFDLLLATLLIKISIQKNDPSYKFIAFSGILAKIQSPFTYRKVLLGVLSTCALMGSLSQISFSYSLECTEKNITAAQFSQPGAASSTESSITTATPGIESNLQGKSPPPTNYETKLTENATPDQNLGSNNTSSAVTKDQDSPSTAVPKFRFSNTEEVNSSLFIMKEFTLFMDFFSTLLSSAITKLKGDGRGFDPIRMRTLFVRSLCKIKVHIQDQKYSSTIDKQAVELKGDTLFMALLNKLSYYLEFFIITKDLKKDSLFINILLKMVAHLVKSSPVLISHLLNQEFLGILEKIENYGTSINRVNTIYLYTVLLEAFPERLYSHFEKAVVLIQGRNVKLEILHSKGMFIAAYLPYLSKLDCKKILVHRETLENLFSQISAIILRANEKSTRVIELEMAFTIMAAFSTGIGFVLFPTEYMNKLIDVLSPTFLPENFVPKKHQVTPDQPTLLAPSSTKEATKKIAAIRYYALCVLEATSLFFAQLYCEVQSADPLNISSFHFGHLIQQSITFEKRTAEWMYQTITLVSEFLHQDHVVTSLELVKLIRIKVYKICYTLPNLLRQGYVDNLYSTLVKHVYSDFLSKVSVHHNSFMDQILPKIHGYSLLHNNASIHHLPATSKDNKGFNVDNLQYLSKEPQYFDIYIQSFDLPEATTYEYDIIGFLNYQGFDITREHLFKKDQSFCSQQRSPNPNLISSDAYLDTLFASTHFAKQSIHSALHHPAKKYADFHCHSLQHSIHKIAVRIATNLRFASKEQIHVYIQRKAIKISTEIKSKYNFVVTKTQIKLFIMNLNYYHDHQNHIYGAQERSSAFQRLPLRKFSSNQNKELLDVSTALFSLLFKEFTPQNKLVFFNHLFHSVSSELSPSQNFSSQLLSQPSKNTTNENDDDRLITTLKKQTVESMCEEVAVPQEKKESPSLFSIPKFFFGAFNASATPEPVVSTPKKDTGSSPFPEKTENFTNIKSSANSPSMAADRASSISSLRTLNFPQQNTQTPCLNIHLGNLPSVYLLANVLTVLHIYFSSLPAPSCANNHHQLNSAAPDSTNNLDLSFFESDFKNVILEILSSDVPFLKIIAAEVLGLYALHSTTCNNDKLLLTICEKIMVQTSLNVRNGNALAIGHILYRCSGKTMLPALTQSCFYILCSLIVDPVDDLRLWTCVGIETFMRSETFALLNFATPFLLKVLPRIFMNNYANDLNQAVLFQLVSNCIKFSAPDLLSDEKLQNQIRHLVLYLTSCPVVTGVSTQTSYKEHMLLNASFSLVYGFATNLPKFVDSHSLLKYIYELLIGPSLSHLVMALKLTKLSFKFDISLFSTSDASIFESLNSFFEIFLFKLNHVIVFLDPEHVKECIDILRLALKQIGLNQSAPDLLRKTLVSKEYFLTKIESVYLPVLYHHCPVQSSSFARMVSNLVKINPYQKESSIFSPISWGFSSGYIKQQQSEDNHPESITATATATTSSPQMDELNDSSVSNSAKNQDIKNHAHQDSFGNVSKPQDNNNEATPQPKKNLIVISHKSSSSTKFVLQQILGLHQELLHSTKLHLLILFDELFQLEESCSLSNVSFYRFTQLGRKVSEIIGLASSCSNSWLPQVVNLGLCIALNTILKYSHVFDPDNKEDSLLNQFEAQIRAVIKLVSSKLHHVSTMKMYLNLITIWITCPVFTALSQTKFYLDLLSTCLNEALEGFQYLFKPSIQKSGLYIHDLVPGPSPLNCTSSLHQPCPEAESTLQQLLDFKSQGVNAATDDPQISSLSSDPYPVLALSPHFCIAQLSFVLIAWTILAGNSLPDHILSQRLNKHLACLAKQLIISNISTLNHVILYYLANPVLFGSAWPEAHQHLVQLKAGPHEPEKALFYMIASFEIPNEHLDMLILTLLQISISENALPVNDPVLFKTILDLAQRSLSMPQFNAQSVSKLTKINLTVWENITQFLASLYAYSNKEEDLSSQFVLLVFKQLLASNLTKASSRIFQLILDVLLNGVLTSLTTVDYSQICTRKIELARKILSSTENCNRGLCSLLADLQQIVQLQQQQQVLISPAGLKKTAPRFKFDALFIQCMDCLVGLLCEKDPVNLVRNSLLTCELVTLFIGMLASKNQKVSEYAILLLISINKRLLSNPNESSQQRSFVLDTLLFQLNIALKRILSVEPSSKSSPSTVDEVLLYLEAYSLVYLDQDRAQAMNEKQAACDDGVVTSMYLEIFVQATQLCMRANRCFYQALKRIDFHYGKAAKHIVRLCVAMFWDVHDTIGESQVLEYIHIVMALAQRAAAAATNAKDQMMETSFSLLYLLTRSKSLSMRNKAATSIIYLSNLDAQLSRSLIMQLDTDEQQRLINLIKSATQFQ